MFTGSVCAYAREWFKANSRAFAGKNIVCGCSGNFTIETVLSQATDPPANITSSDISLYSSALGVYFSGDKALKVTVDPDFQKLLAGKSKTPLGLAATLVVMLEVAPFASRKTAYHIRMSDRILDNFEQYYEAARDKLKTRKKALQVDKYLPVDVRKVIATRNSSEIFLSFMPTYAGGYERLYKFLDATFTWPARPKCETLTADDKTAMLRTIHDQGNYVHIDDTQRDFMPIKAIIQGGRSRPVFIYSDLKGLDAEVYERAKIQHQQPQVEMLGSDDEISTDDVSIIPLTAPEFAWVRDQYLSVNIMPADPTWRYGVCIDGKLIGVVGWARGQDGETYYLMCDVAVRSDRYKRLSKLVILIGNTREMLHILRQQTGRFWHRFSTTAFTEKSTSMKYRGVLEQKAKKPGMINYTGTFDRTLAKAVKKWRKLEKHAQD